MLFGMGTVCRYVLLGMGTVRGYGTWVRYVGAVRGYAQKMWSYFQNVALIAEHFGIANSITFSENRYGGYTVPVYRPYPRHLGDGLLHRRAVLVCRAKFVGHRAVEDNMPCTLLT